MANSRFRYVANGQQPVTITGFVQDIEENYFEIHPEPDVWYSDGAKCYYADAREALHLYRDQAVTVTGRVSGESYGDIVMFMCDVHEVVLETNPTLTREQTRDSVVRVHCEMGSNWLFEGEVYGTGVVVDSTQGLILTAHHVVEEDNGCENITVERRHGGERIPATLVKHCASIDQAYLLVEGSLSDIPELYEASAQARDDQTVYYWGWGSEGFRWGNGIVTDNAYSATSRTTFNARAVPGDSGSPVFNEFGHLLGILTSSNQSDRANYYAWGCEP